jgi:glycosyltransferase involved in cell wall biosynthesis
MRVTHIITRLIVGGAQENTLASIRGLHTRHHVDVELISGPTTGPEGSLETEARSLPIPFTVLPALVRPIHPWLDLQAWRALTRHLKQRRPDIVHTHSGKAGFLGRLAARRARIPIVVHTIHGPSFGPFQNPLANAVFRTAEKAAARATTHFIAVADAMSRQYLAAGIGRPDQFTRIFSGFDLAPFLNARPRTDLRQHLGLREDHFVIGKIARLFALKGHNDLISAAPAFVSHCPNARFLLVGDGTWRNRLQQSIARLNLTPYFIFAGLVPPAIVPDYIALMDVLIHLSRREGLPRALPQAMAVGRPILAYNLDGAPEVCRDNETGFLINPDDQTALVSRLLQLNNDPPLRQRLAARGRAMAQAEFSDTTMADSIHHLYRALCQPSPPR